MQKRMGKPSSRLDQIISDTIVVGSMVVIGVLILLFSFKTEASYTYEANQALIDLTGASGTTSLVASDDGVSNAFALGFTFDYYGQAFTQARVATNGCLHFKTSGTFCNDYTPDPLSGQHTYTMYPFWTDLIRDNGSKVLAKSFSDKTVFGWYGMREYNRSGSDNSFEVILWANDTFEFRYGGLDVSTHDVLIGETGSGAAQAYQYLFHDECGTGTTNSSNCVNTDWNATSFNTALENGGSLYGLGSGNAVDCSDALNDASCSGYASAYLTQQCDLTQLYSETCPFYWEAYDDQQCADDSQYAPFCAGYTQEDSVAFFNEEENYGYAQEDMWYDEEFDEWLDPNDPCYENRCEGFTDSDWYALDTEQFGQEQVDEWFGTDITFGDDGMVDFESTPMTSYEEVDVLMDVWDTEQEQYELVTYDVLPMDATIIAHELIIIEELQHEEIHEEVEREELEVMEEAEERFEEELAETEEIIEEQQIAEEREERVAEEEQEREEEREEEHFEDELFAEEENSPNEEKSSVRVSALSVVANTIRTATNSISTVRRSSAGTYSSSANGSYTNSSSNSAASSSSSGVSTSSSPSRSDQIASSTMQNNRVLSMSSGGTGNVSVFVTPMPTVDDSPQMVMAEVQVQDMQGEIDTAVSGVMTASEADQVADKIIAQNIEAQKEQAEQEQEETGEYGDQSTLVAYLGYVPSFDAYKIMSVPRAQTWYEPRAIYEGVAINDNTQAFYGLSGASLTTLSNMISMQPNL